MVSLRGHQPGNLNIRKNIGNLLRMTLCVQRILKNTTNYHDLGKTNTPRRMLKQQHGRKYNAGRKFTISWLQKYSMVKTNTRYVNLRYHDCEKYKKIASRERIWSPNEYYRPRIHFTKYPAYGRYMRYHTYYEAWHRAELKAAFLEQVPERSDGLNSHLAAQCLC